MFSTQDINAKMNSLQVLNFLCPNLFSWLQDTRFKTSIKYTVTYGSTANRPKLMLKAHTWEYKKTNLCGNALRHVLTIRTISEMSECMLHNLRDISAVMTIIIGCLTQ